MKVHALTLRYDNHEPYYDKEEGEFLIGVFSSEEKLKDAEIECRREIEDLCRLTEGDREDLFRGSTPFSYKRLRIGLIYIIRPYSRFWDSEYMQRKHIDFIKEEFDLDG